MLFKWICFEICLLTSVILFSKRDISSGLFCFSRNQTAILWNTFPQILVQRARIIFWKISYKSQDWVSLTSRRTQPSKLFHGDWNSCLCQSFHVSISCWTLCQFIQSAKCLIYVVILCKFLCNYLLHFRLFCINRSHTFQFVFLLQSLIQMKKISQSNCKELKLLTS